MSLRRRVTSRLLIALGLGWAAAAALILVIDRTVLLDAFDSGLTAKGRVLGSLLSAVDDRIDFDFAGELFPEFEGHGEIEYFQLWARGEVLETSASLGDARLPLRVGDVDTPALWDLQLPDGRDGRAVGVVIPVDVPDRLGGTPAPPDRPASPAPLVSLVVARSRESLDSLIAALAGASVLALLLAGGAAWLAADNAVRRGLAPIDQFVERVQAIDPGARPDGAGTSAGLDPDCSELATLALRLDDLAERVHAEVDTQRRMTAALAHEIRNPVAELRAACDVLEHFPRDPAPRERLIGISRSVSLRLTRLVDTLLRYARIEAGQETARLVEMPLRTALGAGEASERVQFDGPTDISVRSDPELLALIFDNLIRNALEHGRGPIRIRWSTAGRCVRVSVSNSAPGLRQADLVHLTEPFWQKDDARSSSGASGLGLTLCSALAGVLEARLQLKLSAGELVAEVTLPAAPHAHPHDQESP